MQLGHVMWGAPLAVRQRDEQEEEMQEAVRREEALKQSLLFDCTTKVYNTHFPLHSLLFLPLWYPFTDSTGHNTKIHSQCQNKYCKNQNRIMPFCNQTVLNLMDAMVRIAKPAEQLKRWQVAALATSLDTHGTDGLVLKLLPDQLCPVLHWACCLSMGNTSFPSQIHPSPKCFLTAS